MILRHSEIASCAVDVRSWARARLYGTGAFIRTGYAGLVKLGIYRYHDCLDVNQARQHLEYLGGRFGLTDKSRIRAAEQDLIRYIAWIEQTRPVVAIRRIRLRYDIGAGWLLGGEVSRVDVDVASRQYRGILLGDIPRNWRAELRIPLMQRALAARIQRPETEIAVGFQRLDGSDLQTVSVGRRELDEAEDQVRELAVRLSQEMRRQRRRRAAS